jgi:hypothetical protein
MTCPAVPSEAFVYAVVRNGKTMSGIPLPSTGPIETLRPSLVSRTLKQQGLNACLLRTT